MKSDDSRESLKKHAIVIAAHKLVVSPFFLTLSIVIASSFLELISPRAFVNLSGFLVFRK